MFVLNISQKNEQNARHLVLSSADVEETNAARSDIWRSMQERGGWYFYLI